VAKNVTLQVNVNDAQFNAFTKNFNNFSNQIKGLTNQFNQINQSIQNANKSSNALLRTMQSIYDSAASVLKPIGRITSHFIKWSTIIGGVTALLGMGGGLFGIERLANSIMQKRRQVMGLGGTYGAAQASIIAGRSLFDDPAGILQNVQLGLHGDVDKMIPLMEAGIPFGSKMTSEEALDKLLKKVPDLLKNAPAGMELTTLQAYGYGKIFGTRDLIRLTTEEGRKEIAERQKLEAAIRKELELSPKAQKAWSDLEIQFRLAAAHIQSTFGERLAEMAPHLTRLSQALEHAFDALMKSEVVSHIIKILDEWIDDLSKYLEGDKLEEDLKAFSDEVENVWIPYLRSMGISLKSFGDTLSDIVGVLKEVWGWVKWLRDINDRYRVDIPGLIGGQGPVTQPSTTGPGGTDTPAPEGWKKPFTQRSPITTPSTPPLYTTLPGTATAPIISKQFGANPFGVPGMGFGRGPGGTVLPNPNQGYPNIFGVTPGAGVGAFNQRFGSFSGGNNFASFSQRMGGGNASITGGSTNITSWSNAAARASPGGGGNLNFSSNTQMASIDRRRQQGALSANNWQMSRTAKLEIRNVPGSNVFMTGAGMAV